MGWQALQVTDFKDPRRAPHNPKVVGSNPTPATNFLDKLDTYRRKYKSGAAGAFKNIVGIRIVEGELMPTSCYVAAARY
jgi:hypothetical protein